MLNIGPPELILIFIIALVIVGPQRLPELGRTIGKGMRELRKMQDEVKDLVNTGMGDDFRQTAAELKKSATELKSATDVRSAFRSDEPRTRPHASKRSTEPEGPASVDAGQGLDAPGLNPPAGQDWPSVPPTTATTPKDDEAPGE